MRGTHEGVIFGAFVTQCLLNERSKRPSQPNAFFCSFSAVFLALRLDNVTRCFRQVLQLRHDGLATTNQQVHLSSPTLFFNPCERTLGIVASAGAVTCCTNTHLDQMSRFDLNSSRTAFTDACLAARDTFVSSSCLLFFFLANMMVSSISTSICSWVPSVLYHALLIALSRHHRRHVNDLLNVVGTGTSTICSVMLSDMRHWWTTLLASRASFYTSHTQPTFIFGIGTHEHALRCHVAPPGIQRNWKRRLAMSSNASTKARNLLSIVLVLTVHREEMENSVQDATRCSVQFVHNPSGNESLVLSPPRTCNAWISLPQALRLWREKKRC